MDDLVQAVVDEVLRRQGQRPALLVGRAPQAAAGWRFVTDGPYEAVILGSLTAAELLRFPDEASAQALLEGKPVYYCPEGLDYRRHAKTANRALWSALLAAERRLRALGERAQPLDVHPVERLRPRAARAFVSGGERADLAGKVQQAVEQLGGAAVVLFAAVAPDAGGNARLHFTAPADALAVAGVQLVGAALLQLALLANLRQLAERAEQLLFIRIAELCGQRAGAALDQQRGE